MPDNANPPRGLPNRCGGGAQARAARCRQPGRWAWRGRWRRPAAERRGSRRSRAGGDTAAAGTQKVPSRDPAREAAAALARSAETVAAAPVSRAELAPLLETATRDLFVAMRGLARCQFPGQPAGTGPGTLPAQIREAAHSVGLAWQYLAAANSHHHPVVGAAGPAAGLCAAAARAISAWSRPEATIQDGTPIAELVRAAAGAMAATAGYLAAGTGGLRACRYRHAERCLDIAAEQLRQALACAHATRPQMPGGAIPPPRGTGDRGKPASTAGAHPGCGDRSRDRRR